MHVSRGTPTYLLSCLLVDAQIPNSDASISKPSATLVSSPLLTASIEYFTPSGALEMILIQDGFGSRDQIGVRHHFIDQADAIRLLGIDDFAGENEL